MKPAARTRPAVIYKRGDCWVLRVKPPYLEVLGAPFGVGLRMNFTELSAAFDVVHLLRRRYAQVKDAYFQNKRIQARFGSSPTPKSDEPSTRYDAKLDRLVTICEPSHRRPTASYDGMPIPYEVTDWGERCHKTSTSREGR